MHARLLLSGLLAASLSFGLISTVEAQCGHGGCGVAANPHCGYCGTGYCGWRAPCWKNTHAYLGQYWASRAACGCCGTRRWPDWHCGCGLGKLFCGCGCGQHGCGDGYGYGPDYGPNYGPDHEYYGPGPAGAPAPTPPPLPRSVRRPTTAALQGPTLR